MPPWNWPCGWRCLPDIKSRDVFAQRGRSAATRLNSRNGQTPGVAGAASPGACNKNRDAAEGHSAHSGLQLDHCDGTSFPESPPTTFTRPMTVAPGFQGHARHLYLRAACRASRLQHIQTWPNCSQKVRPAGWVPRHAWSTTKDGSSTTAPRDRWNVEPRHVE